MQARPRDRDRDGLRDGYELKRSHTNPRRADTDRDRLRDGYELKRSHTNPRRADTDGDGLRDGYELKRSHTNPRRADTDGDGVADGVEVLLALQPERPPAACANGLDDDADGLIDLDDPGCKNSQDDDEWNPVSAPPPVASYTDWPANPQVGHPVSFDATSSVCATPCLYTWEDDGPDGPGGTQWPLGTGETLAFTFRVAGTKHVRLTVKDSQGRSASVVHDVVVSSAAPPPPALPQCSDGVDNDADGKVDFPADPGCLDPSDNDESDPQPPPASGGCTRSADPSSFASAFAAAVAGDVICLASGDYGTFAGGSKSGTVTVTAASGATPKMRLDLQAAANLRLDSLTLGNATGSPNYIRGTSHDVTVSNSHFVGLLELDTSQPNADIVLDGNDHYGVDVFSGSIPAQVTVWSAGDPTGVTIENSRFGGSAADGIQADRNGIQILGNEFANLDSTGSDGKCGSSGACHTDPIQIYGGSSSPVSGVHIARNYFHNESGNISVYVMMADGGQNELVEDNVFRAGPQVDFGLTWYSDANSTIRHNTFERGACEYGPCGLLNLGAKTSSPAGATGQDPGYGTVIRDNVLGDVGNGGGGQQSSFSADHNLTRVSVAGAANIVGDPLFVGPLTSYSGFHLAAGSPGKGAASDGTDIGIR